MNIIDFTEYLFNRPVGAVEWYFSNEHEDPLVAKELLVRLTAQVFKDIAKTASRFCETQVCMGLQYLINPSCGPIPYLYLDTSVDFSVRKEAIVGMEFVFRDIFSRIDARMVYEESNSVPLSYRSMCYMWWDVFPRHGVPRSLDMESTDILICQTISSILKMGGLACQESALHGLNHWFSSRPDEVVSAIESYLPFAPVELKQYANAAMQGMIQ